MTDASVSEVVHHRVRISVDQCSNNFDRSPVFRWNNIRMAMETALVMSHAMGRTLVLP